MISVIVCSIDKNLANQIKENITATIGVPWELIMVDNNELRQSISRVYNIGASQAKYELLCFVHEDVLFKDDLWGRTIETLFKNDAQLGVVGVAGSKYKSKALSGWYTGLADQDCCNILHINENNEERLLYANPEPSKNYQQVISIDGVFICTRKIVWEKIRFNESLLTGFHCYDIDFSVRASKRYRLAVTYEVKMIHLTEGGSFGNAWIDYTILWHKSYRNLLPVFVNSGTPSNPKRKEVRIMKNWLMRLKIEGISIGRKINWVIKSGSIYHIQLWPVIVVFFVFRRYKKILSLAVAKKSNHISE